MVTRGLGQVCFIQYLGLQVALPENQRKAKELPTEFFRR
jgi:hypothetical protein